MVSSSVQASAKACSFALAAVFFFSVILKVGMLTEAVDDVLTKQLHTEFGFNAAIISVGMLAAVVLAIGLAAAIAAGMASTQTQSRPGRRQKTAETRA